MTVPPKSQVDLFLPTCLLERCGCEPRQLVRRDGVSPGRPNDPTLMAVVLPSFLVKKKKNGSLADTVTQRYETTNKNAVNVNYGGNVKSE